MWVNPSRGNLVTLPTMMVLKYFRRALSTTIKLLFRYTKSLVLFAILVLLLHLLLVPPFFLIRECPDILGSLRSPHIESAHVIQTTYDVDCAAVLAGNKEVIQAGAVYANCKPRSSISDKQYVRLTRNCDAFKRTRGYITDTGSEEERSFPIAFSILMFEHVEQAERLLRAVYRPQNFYCIHVDAKSKTSIHNAMQAIAGCFDNVFIASTMVDVTWAWFPVLEAEIICMKDLLRRSQKWKYFINLTGREFPLKTNLELVRILRVYRGGNDVDGTLWRRPILWTKYHWRSESWQSWYEKTPVPHGYNIAKGSTHIVVTRAFVQFAIFNHTAVDLLDWMRDIRSPDEHFFATLNHNPQLGVPGAYTENPDLKHFLSRFKIWEAVGQVCAGTWFRYICNFGLGDLMRVGHAPELFVNKFRYELHPVAFNCMEQWHANRTKLGVGADFNLTFYSSQPWVKDHH